jgi:hypothetical protein
MQEYAAERFHLRKEHERIHYAQYRESVILAA